MNKNILFAVASALTIGLASCDKSNPKMDDKAASAQTATAGTNIAYVEVDSLMSQYTFCKEQSKVLETKGENIQKTLADKQQALQAAAANFQQKLQQNAYSQAEAERINAGLQKQSSDLQVLAQRLQGELQTETEKFNTALHDSLQHYLAIYNKDKKYAMIFAKQGDNILYADKAYDITAQVVAGLNKAYKPAAKQAKKEK